jgi:hypothetical protein
MSEKDAKVWQKLSDLFPADVAQQQQSLSLYQDFIKVGYMRLSLAQALQLDPAVVFNFYYRLARFTTPGRPYYRKKTSKWLQNMNVFEIDLRKIDGWLGLLKIAPLFAQQALCLAPITTCHQEQSDLLCSHIHMDEHLYHPLLQQAGIVFADFVTWVFEALCRLKIAFGVTLYPYVSQHATVYSKAPQLFMPALASDEKVYFHLQRHDVQTYLAKICQHYAEVLRCDFIYFNFADQQQVDLLAQHANLRPSLACLGSSTWPIHTTWPIDIVGSWSDGKYAGQVVPTPIQKSLSFLASYLQWTAFWWQPVVSDIPQGMKTHEDFLPKCQHLISREYAHDLLQLVYQGYKNEVIIILCACTQAISQKTIDLSLLMPHVQMYTVQSMLYRQSQLMIQPDQLVVNAQWMVETLDIGDVMIITVL